MKHKSLFVGILICCALVACKKEVDVFGTNDTITVQTLNKNHSHIETGEGLSFTIAEYTFQKDGTGRRVERTIKDGEKTFDQTIQITWELGDYKEYAGGRTVHIYPKNGDAYDVLWKDGMIREDGDYQFSNISMLTSSPVDNFKAVYSDLHNTTWHMQDSTCMIDTVIFYRDTTVTRVVRDTLKDVTGKDSIVLVKKEFPDSIKVTIYDTVGVNFYSTVDFSFMRDAGTFANTASYKYTYKGYVRDTIVSPDTTILVPKLVKDSAWAADFHWGYTAIASKKKCAVKGITETQDTLLLTLSDLDIKKKDLTIEGYLLQGQDTLIVHTDKLKLQ